MRVHKRLVISGVLLLALALRLFALGKRCLTIDECYSLFISKNLFWQILNRGRMLLADPHPPLSYVLMRLLLPFGESEFALRISSVALGVALVFVGYKLAKMLFGYGEGIICALLLAISPFLVLHSQDVRMYMLFAFLGAASTYYFLKILNEGKGWMGFVVSGILMLYTHYVAFLLVAAQAALFVFLWKQTRDKAANFFLSLAVLAIAYLPWVNVMLAQFNYAKEGMLPSLIPRRGLVIPYTFFVFSLGETFLPVRSSGGLFSGALALLIAGAVYGFIFAYGLLKGERRKAAQLSILLALPILFLYVLSWRLHRIYNSVKYVIMVAPVYTLVLSAGLSSMRRRWGVALLAAVVFLSFLSIRNYFFDGRYAGEDWRGVSGYIEQNSAAGDLVLIDAGYMKLVCDYYYKGDAQTIGLPLISQLNGEKAVGMLKRLSAGHNRVWLLLSHNWRTPGAYAEALGGIFPEQMSRDFAGIRVCLFKK